MDRECPRHGIVHPRKDHVALHRYCPGHGHCLEPGECTTARYCSMNVRCPHHGRTHKTEHERKHRRCAMRGRCQYPRDCTERPFCPTLGHST